MVINFTNFVLEANDFFSYFSSSTRCFIGFREIEGVCTGINIAYDYEKAVFYE